MKPEERRLLAKVFGKPSHCCGRNGRAGRADYNPTNPARNEDEVGGSEGSSARRNPFRIWHPAGVQLDYLPVDEGMTKVARLTTARECLTGDSAGPRMPI